MTLKKSEIKTPALPTETVDAPEIGGEVIVRGLLLRDRLSVFASARAEDGDFGHVSRILAASIVDESGVPIYDQPQWEIWGAVHFEMCMRLYSVAKRLAGLDTEADTKN